MTDTRIQIIATALAALLALSVVGIGQVAAAGSTQVTIQPDSAEVDVGETTTFDVVVQNADGGVGAYNISVSLGDTEAAEITAIAPGGNPSQQTTETVVADDGSSARVTAALANTDDTGSVTAATVTVEGTADGVTDLNVTVNALGDEQGMSYDVTGTSGASLTVGSDEPGEPAPPALPGLSNQPTDPDGDGHYEDVDGDGEVRFNDVVELFEHFSSEAVEDNPDAFDFNENGRLDFDDIIRLFLSI